jgi:hypothetical protein
MKIHATLDILPHRQFSSRPFYLIPSELQVPGLGKSLFLLRRWKYNSCMDYLPALMSKGVVKQRYYTHWHRHIRFFVIYGL